MTDELYDERIKALAQAGDGDRRLESPGVSVRLDNALCGDRIALDLAVDDRRVAALGHLTRGCLLCRAAAALLARKAPGLSFADIKRAQTEVRALLEQGTPPEAWPELAMFAPVRAHRSRHGCVLLPFRALAAAMAEPPGKPPET